MSTGLDWLSITSGVLGGGIVVAVWETIKTFLKRPVLECSHLQRGCLVRTPFRDPNGQISDSCFLRLRVINRGRTTARSVQAHVIRIKKTPHGGNVVEMDDEVFPLTWAHPIIEQKDVPPEVFFFVNVFMFVDRVAGERATLVSNQLPSRLNSFFDDPAEYDLEIIVSCDNAKPVRVSLKFSHESRLDTLVWR
jgi:hypothetical protein